MATKQTAINATNVDSTVLSQDLTRRYLYLRNYSTSGQTMWIAFGKAATAGTAGELEMVAGGEYVFGGPLPPNVANLPQSFFLPVCPTEEVHVITSTGTATGAAMTQ